MKKLLSLLLLPLFMGGVLALALPCPMGITVDPALEGVLVTAENVDTGTLVTQYTSEHGDTLIEWASADCVDGDNIIITIGDKSQRVILPYYQIINFELDGYDCLPIKDCPTCVICDVCADCPEPVECPTAETNPYILPIATLIVGLGIGWQAFASKLGVIMKIFNGMDPGEGCKVVLRKRSDTGKPEVELTQHKHQYISGYHSIRTIHRNHPHPKGVIDVDYDADGKYIDGGV